MGQITESPAFRIRSRAGLVDSSGPGMVESGSAADGCCLGAVRAYQPNGNAATVTRTSGCLSHKVAGSGMVHANDLRSMSHQGTYVRFVLAAGVSVARKNSDLER